MWQSPQQAVRCSQDIQPEIQAGERSDRGRCMSEVYVQKCSHIYDLLFSEVPHCGWALSAQVLESHIGAFGHVNVLSG